MSAAQELLNFGSEGFGGVLKGAAAIGTTGALLIGSVKRVPKNHKGIPTIRGNPERAWGRKKGERYGSVGSGYFFVWPFFGGMESISMQEQPKELPKIEVTCTDGKHIADGSAVWSVKQSEVNDRQRLPFFSKERRIAPLYGAHARLFGKYVGLEPIHPTTPISENDENLYRSLFKVDKVKLDNFVAMKVRTGVVAAARTLSSDELLVPNASLARTEQLYGHEFDAQGVQIDGIYITSFAASEAQVIVNAAKEIFGKRPDDDTGSTDVSIPIPDHTVHLQVVADSPPGA